MRRFSREDWHLTRVVAQTDQIAKNSCYGSLRTRSLPYILYEYFNSCAVRSSQQRVLKDILFDYYRTEKSSQLDYQYQVNY